MEGWMKELGRGHEYPVQLGVTEDMLEGHG